MLSDDVLDAVWDFVLAQKERLASDRTQAREKKVNGWKNRGKSTVSSL